MKQVKSEALKVKKECGNDSVKALELCEKLAQETNQDWDNETTHYTFKDGSKLSISSQFMYVSRRN